MNYTTLLRTLRRFVTHDRPGQYSQSDDAALLDVQLAIGIALFLFVLGMAVAGR